MADATAASEDTATSSEDRPFSNRRIPSVSVLKTMPGTGFLSNTPLSFHTLFDHVCMCARNAVGLPVRCYLRPRSFTIQHTPPFPSPSPPPLTLSLRFFGFRVVLRVGSGPPSFCNADSFLFGTHTHATFAHNLLEPSHLSSLFLSPSSLWPFRPRRKKTPLSQQTILPSSVILHGHDPSHWRAACSPDCCHPLRTTTSIAPET